MCAIVSQKKYVLGMNIETIEVVATICEKVQIQIKIASIEIFKLYLMTCGF